MSNFGRTKKRLAFVGLAAAVALAASAGVALAVFPSDNVASYAGCLNTNASPGGTFVNVAVGDAPARPCGSGQVLVHLSGGDITSVSAGSGLTGGGTNGAVTLSLAAGQSLPQTCSNSQVPKWNGPSWSCGSDNDTTYSNGTGLDLGGTTFSVSPSYRLPQNCGSGQVAKSSGSNSWSCQNDESAQSHAYAAYGGFLKLSQDGETTVTTLNIPNDPGAYVITAVQTLTGNASPGGSALCKLHVNGNDVFEGGGTATGQNNAKGSATEAAALQLAVPGRIEVDCTSLPDSDILYVHQSSIVALKVGAIN